MIVDCRAGPQKNVQQHVTSNGKSNTELWIICLKMFLYTHDILAGKLAEVVITVQVVIVCGKQGSMKLKI